MFVGSDCAIMLIFIFTMSTPMASWAEVVEKPASVSFAGSRGVHMFWSAAAAWTGRREVHGRQDDWYSISTTPIDKHSCDDGGGAFDA
eukprot:6199321-Pyramimonas_sp.AAC.1